MAFNKEDRIVLAQIFRNQHLIIQKLNEIMGQQEDMAADLQEIKDATTAIATKIANLPPAGSVTQAQLDELKADADALKAIGQ